MDQWQHKSMDIVEEKVAADRDKAAADNTLH
jgi:hypothetical protein